MPNSPLASVTDLTAPEDPLPLSLWENDSALIDAMASLSRACSQLSTDHAAVGTPEGSREARFWRARAERAADEAWLLYRAARQEANEWGDAPY